MGPRLTIAGEHNRRTLQCRRAKATGRLAARQNCPAEDKFQPDFGRQRTSTLDRAGIAATANG
jgi:hypothetical protein